MYILFKYRCRELKTELNEDWKPLWNTFSLGKVPNDVVNGSLASIYIASSATPIFKEKQSLAKIVDKESRYCYWDGKEAKRRAFEMNGRLLTKTSYNTGQAMHGASTGFREATMLHRSEFFLTYLEAATAAEANIKNVSRRKQTH